MAIKRPKEYKNFVPPDTGKAYRISGNADGTSKITDVTQYLSEGDTWTAADANMIWDELENVITGDEKGAAGGVATLDNSGKVPSGQLPSMDYIPTNQKGAAGGVASLGADGLVPTAQLPEIGAVKSVNGQTGEVVLYTYGAEELTAGTSGLATGTMYLMYE